jgi:tetratricopeptide (TPR) repeat protein
MMFQADKAAKPILANEGGVPSFELNRVVGMYEAIIGSKPGSGYSVNARFKIAGLYAADKSFDLSREQYDYIIKTYANNAELVASALFEKGRTYEIENNWTEALRQFNIIIKDYEQTSLALKVPLYIARYYMQKEDTVKAVKSYQAAIDYFQKISEKYPNTKGSLLCENLVVKAYVEMGAWQEALNYLYSLEKKYKLGPETLLVMARIYKEKLDDQTKKQEIYDQILKEFPDSQAAGVIKKEIEMENETPEQKAARLRREKKSLLRSIYRR